MGTWDATILGNDTSAEVYEFFFEQYNQGTPVDEIDALLAERFEVSLSLDEDTYNVLFAQALAHWETGTLDGALHGAVVEAVYSGADLAAYRSLDASDALVRARSTALTKFLAKLSKPRPTPRKRRKPPVPLETPFVPGACLAFSRAEREYGGVVIIESGFFARHGSMGVAATSLVQDRPPTFADFAKSRLHGFSWEAVFDEAARFAAPNGKTGRIHTMGIGYVTAAGRAPYFERANRYFTVVGHLPEFTQVLLGTSGCDTTSDSGLADCMLRLHENGAEQRSREALTKLATLLSTRNHNR